MLAEANRRKHERGQDVVIGYVETHKRPDTEAAIGDLEVVPRQKIEYRGTVFEEMDTDAVIARRPRWVLVDELAHTNIPGSKYEKRYQDVQEILAAGHQRRKHAQRPAPGESERHRVPDHGRQGAGDRAGLGAGAGR